MTWWSCSQRLAENISFAIDNFDRADEKTKADERIEYLASHDSLTKLPNRLLFNDRLRRHRGCAPQRAIPRGGAVHRSGPVQVDQRFARPRGRRPAAEGVAPGAWRPARERRLRGGRRRVRGDAGGSSRTRKMGSWLGKMQKSARPARSLRGDAGHSTGSLGVALLPLDGCRRHALMRNADTAMYRAKDDGRRRALRSTPAINAQTHRALTLETALRRAVEQGEFRLYYQPLVVGARADGRPRGAAALGASAARPAGSADRFHSDCRGNRAHRKDRAMGSQRSLQPGASRWQVLAPSRSVS